MWRLNPTRITTRSNIEKKVLDNSVRSVAFVQETENIKSKIEQEKKKFKLSLFFLAQIFVTDKHFNIIIFPFSSVLFEIRKTITLVSNVIYSIVFHKKQSLALQLMVFIQRLLPNPFNKASTAFISTLSLVDYHPWVKA